MPEIIPIVNELDEVIDSVEKHNFDKTTGRIYRTVSFYLFDKSGKILIQRRADSKKTYAGKWDFAAAAGHVSLGESYLETVQREVSEEIGLENINFLLAGKDFTETPEGKRRFTQIYWAKEDFSVEDLKISHREVSEVKLVSVEELKNMLVENPGQFANYDGPDTARKNLNRIIKLSN